MHVKYFADRLAQSIPSTAPLRLPLSVARLFLLSRKSCIDQALRIKATRDQRLVSQPPKIASSIEFNAHRLHPDPQSESQLNYTAQSSLNDLLQYRYQQFVDGQVED